MPALSRWMIRLSLMALLLGALVGGSLLAEVPAVTLHEGIVRRIHLDLMLYGWLVQFVLGVAYWMLPRYAAPPERGPASAGWSAFGLFEGGLVLALLGEGFSSFGIASVGRMVVAVGTLLFVVLLFPRVKAFGG